MVFERSNKADERDDEKKDATEYEAAKYAICDNANRFGINRSRYECD